MHGGLLVNSIFKSLILMTQGEFRALMILRIHRAMGFGIQVIPTARIKEDDLVASTVAVGGHRAHGPTKICSPAVNCGYEPNRRSGTCLCRAPWAKARTLHRHVECRGRSGGGRRRSSGR